MEPYKRRYELKLLTNQTWCIIEISTEKVIFNFLEFRYVFDGTPFGEHIENEITQYDPFIISGFEFLEHICNYLNREKDEELLYLSNINNYCL